MTAETRCSAKCVVASGHSSSRTVSCQFFGFKLTCLSPIGTVFAVLSMTGFSFDSLSFSSVACASVQRQSARPIEATVNVPDKGAAGVGNAGVSTPRQSSAKKAAKTGTGMIVGARPSAPDAHVVAEFLDEIRRVGTTRASAGESDGLSESLTIAAVDDWAQFLTEDQAVRASDNELLDRLSAIDSDSTPDSNSSRCTPEMRQFWKEHARVCTDRLSRARSAVMSLSRIAQSHGVAPELSTQAAQRAQAVLALEFGSYDIGDLLFVGLPAAYVEFAVPILQAISVLHAEEPSESVIDFRAQHDLVRAYELEVGLLQHRRIDLNVRSALELDDDGAYCVQIETRRLLGEARWDVYLAQRRWLLAFTSSLDPQLRLRVESKLWSLFVPEFIPDDTCAFAVLDAFQSALSTDPAHSDELLALSDWYRAAYGVAMRRLLDAQHQQLLSQYAPSGTPKPDREEAVFSFDDALAQRERLNQRCLSRMRPFVEGFDVGVVDAVLGVIAESSRSSEAPTASELREKLEARIAEFSKNAARTLREQRAHAESDRRNGRALAGE